MDMRKTMFLELNSVDISQSTSKNTLPVNIIYDSLNLDLEYWGVGKQDLDNHKWCGLQMDSP